MFLLWQAVSKQGDEQDRVSRHGECMIPGAVVNMYEARDTLCDHSAPLKFKIFVV